MQLLQHIKRWIHDDDAMMVMLLSLVFYAKKHHTAWA
jgi:hypothetical protein